MNSVHLVTQEKYRVKNQVEKLSQVHKHPTGQAGHPGTPRCAHSGRIVALGQAVSWPGSAVSQRQAAVSQRSPARPCASCSSARPLAPAACAQRLPRAPRPLTPSRPLTPARSACARAQRSARPPAPSALRARLRPASACRPCACPAPTVPCRSAQWPYRGRAPRALLAMPWPRSRYRLPNSLALSHNTVYVLRYNAHSLQATSLAIQTCLLQYNFCPTPCNTIQD